MPKTASLLRKRTSRGGRSPGLNSALRSLRVKKGFTQKDLGIEMGLPKNYAQKKISQIENGIIAASPLEIQMLCNLLRVTEKELRLGEIELTSSFLSCLTANGLEEADIEFVLHNVVLHKPIVKSIKELCARLRTAVEKNHKGPKRE